MLWQEASLPYPDSEARTFASFVPREGTEEMLTAAQVFARGEGPPVLVLAGSYGSGKSHMLEAIGRAVLDRGFTVRYEMAGRFLVRLRSCFEMDAIAEFSELLDWYYIRYLMLLDDLGMEKPTEWASERLTELVEERLTKGRRLVVATNKSREQMQAVYPRLASRLFGENVPGLRVVYVTATDYRR